MTTLTVLRKNGRVLKSPYVFTDVEMSHHIGGPGGIVAEAKIGDKVLCRLQHARAIAPNRLTGMEDGGNVAYWQEWVVDHCSARLTS